MKANETPKKLYVNFHFIETHSESHQPLVTKQGINKYDIEYVRKDAFIEEVCKYLQENCTYIHPRKGTPTCAVNLTLLKEYLEDIV